MTALGTNIRIFIKVISAITGLSTEDCQNIYNDNPGKTIHQMLNHMLSTLDLSDEQIGKIETFINHCEEEE